MLRPSGIWIETSTSCIHHLQSDLINNMDHMRISGEKGRDLTQSYDKSPPPPPPTEKYKKQRDNTKSSPKLGVLNPHEGSLANLRSSSWKEMPKMCQNKQEPKGMVQLTHKITFSTCSINFIHGKFWCSQNATNQPKLTVELGYMCPRRLWSTSRDTHRVVEVWIETSTKRYTMYIISNRIWITIWAICAFRVLNPHQEASSGPRTEGVPTNNQTGRGSGLCIIWGGLNKSRSMSPPPWKSECNALGKICTRHHPDQFFFRGHGQQVCEVSQYKEKKRYLTQSYDKSPYTIRKWQKYRDNTRSH